MEKKTKQAHAKLCGAKTRSGKPCKNFAMENGRCRMHGGKSTGAPKKNKNAEKHGLFTKYLPEETQELVDAIEEMNRLDLLWENIKIQAAAIIRSQKIMYVKDREDIDKNTIEEISGDVQVDKFQIDTAGQRQAAYLDSQSRAMTTLTRMIKEYEELAQIALKEETDKARLDNLKARTEKIRGISNDIEDTSHLRELILGE